MVPTPQDALDALIGAAQRGRVGQVETILAVHPDLATQSVHAAAVLCDLDAVRGHLADDPSRATSPGPRGWTPLALASFVKAPDDADPVAVIEALVASGADPNDGRSLFVAFEAQHADRLEALLAAGGQPASKDNPRGISLLHHAADDCWNQKLVTRLLEEPVDWDVRCGPHDETVLHAAVRRRRLDALDLFVARGADVNATTRGGDTAWRHAIRRPFPEVAQRLAQLGAAAERQPIDELAEALHAQDEERARALLAQHADLASSLAPEEARLIADLSSQDNTAAVTLLLDHGFDIESRGLDGGTCLQQTCWFAAVSTAQLLVERGADVNAGGCGHESTPLGWVTHGSRYSGGAAGNLDRYQAILELLLTSGAAVDLPGDPPGQPGKRALTDAAPRLQEVLRAHLPDSA